MSVMDAMAVISAGVSVTLVGLVAFLIAGIVRCGCGGAGRGAARGVRRGLILLLVVWAGGVPLALGAAPGDLGEGWLQYAPIALGLGAPLGVFALLLRSRRVRAVADGFSIEALITVQSMRVVGGVFLLAHAAGVLPASFAYPAGYGDVVIGMTAPIALLWWMGEMPLRRVVVTAWAVLGLADFAVAIGTGLMSRPGPLEVFSAGATTAPMSELPLALIPLVIVPLFAMLHVLMLRRVWATAASKATTFACPLGA